MAVGRSPARSGRIDSTISSRLSGCMARWQIVRMRGVLVVPVVDDPRQHVGIGRAGTPAKKSPATQST